MVAKLLLGMGVSEEVAGKIQTICSAVSYSSETRSEESREQVLDLVGKYPELAVVQDADRVDSIGAVGVGRLFCYGSVKAPERGMEGSMQMMRGKCFALEAIMKTQPGKEMAKERTRRLREFDQWWIEEAGGEIMGKEILGLNDVVDVKRA